MRAFQILIVAALIALLLGCQPIEQISKNAPAAQTPNALTVLAHITGYSGFGTVNPNASGAFEILPSVIPSGDIQAIFDAPYPSDLRIRINGVELRKIASDDTGVNVDGFYKVIDLNVNPNPAKWHILVRPPAAQRNLLTYTLAISNVSINPNFPVGTAGHESAPLTIVAITRPVYTLSVTTAGTGGRIGSTPAGIDCGRDCNTSFSQSTTVTLTAIPAQGQRLARWTSNCIPPSICNCFGSRNNCSITLNGTAATATATFERQTQTPPQSACPAPRTNLPGLTHVGQPACASGIIDAHPGAVLACDAQGYFCCEPSTGNNEARCGGPDKRQFAADCRGHSDTRIGPPPGVLDGCYRRP